MDAHTTFEAPEVVDEKDCTAYENTQTGVKVTLPAVSYTHLDVYKRQIWESSVELQQTLHSSQKRAETSMR